MKKDLSILLLCPKADDATSFYRGFGPFAALRQKYNIKFLLPSTVNWASVSMVDIVFIQRPADPATVQVASIAKMCGVPLWVDFDDDNMSVPKSNETAHIFNNPQIKNAISTIARMADIVTVATEFLRKKYSVYDQTVAKNKVILIPNAVDDRYIPIRNNLIPKRTKDKVIAWRGGPGFTKNIEMMIESIVQVAKESEKDKWKFCFMGHEPYEITDKIKNYQFFPWMDFMNYLQAGCQINASAFLYCITPNDHSLSRSHGPWLEASFFGSALLARKTPEMDRPGVLHFETPQEFYEKLTQIVKREVDVTAQAKLSWEAICDNYLLSKVNEKRVEVIERLLGEK